MSAIDVGGTVRAGEELDAIAVETGSKHKVSIYKGRLK